jgi:uncharacterized SAM-binding protein YcdF (DUF218 family)
MFFAKKVLSAFLLPLPASVLLLGIGLALLWFTRRDRLGRVLLSVGFGLLLLSSYNVVSDAFVTPLERTFEPLYPRTRLDTAIRAAGQAPKWIVVLGGGDVADRRVPANDQLGDSAMSRLVEGVRLYRELPGTKLLLSGGVGAGIKHADILGAVAELFRLPPEDVVLDRSAWDTEQEAHNLAARVGSAPFILVTSAVHMPRAVALFRRQRARPIAAPTHHYTLDTPGVSFDELLPSPSALMKMDAATHEYLGTLFSKLRGKI